MRFLGKDPLCEDDECPKVWDDGDGYVIQGAKIFDQAALSEVGQLPAHETVVRIPKRMMRFFPEANGG